MFLYRSESLADIVIEEFEVIDIISVLPINKAIGPDCISHKCVKINYAYGMQTFAITF